MTDVEKARSVSIAYIHHYFNDGYTCRGVEVPFTLPLLNPETSEPTGESYGGIIDAILEKDGELWLCDHKTAGSVSPSYFQELKTNAQLSMYMLACRQAGLPVRGFVWDVIVKPTISPKSLTKADVEAINSTGSYYDFPYDGPDVVWKDKENPQLYGRRVLAKYDDDPDKYFIRRSIYRSDEDLFEYACELRDVILEAAEARKLDDRMLRNFGSCKQFNTLCEFHQLCCGEADVDDGSYVKRSKGNKTGPAKGAYSTSQLHTYQSCKRKWQHRYREGIESARKSYVHATSFGGMFHEAVEIFLRGKLTKPIQLPNTGV